VLRIKEVTVEVLNSPYSATQQLLRSILDEMREIRVLLTESASIPATDLNSRRDLKRNVA
jgi:hypothetical protein